MSRHGSFGTGAACWLIAVLAMACAGVESATPTPASTDAPTHTVPTAAPTPTPSPPTQAPPSPTAIPTAVPTPVSGDVVMAGFAQFLEDQPDFHLVCNVGADVYVGDDSDQLFIYLDGDISGQDFAGTFSMQTTGVSVDADMVVIGDLVYVRPARGEWSSGEEFVQTQPLNPFTSGFDEDFAYGGPVTIEGRALHDLHTDTWVGGDIATIGRESGLRKPKLESSVFDIFVGDDGRPVTSLLEFVVTGRLNGQPVRFEYQVIYDFSQIGEPVVIDAPL
jgi:hypothetical protein